MELMPCIMGVFDSIIEEKKLQSDSKRTLQSNNFTHLSPGVQKLLSHVPDQEIRRTVSSDENLGFRKASSKSTYRSLRAQSIINRSNESLDIISPNVQKMLSNLPDTELIINPGGEKHFNRSFLHAKNDSDTPRTSDRLSDTHSAGCDPKKNSENCLNEKESKDCIKPVPLVSYLHTTPQEIASRPHIGRKSLGKFLQIPSENNLNSSSRTNSEISRPVSLTSIGSCSSSGSSGNIQTGSAYLASAESLDSDLEPNASHGSADSGIAEQPSVVTAETRVLQEVLESEAVYVSDLKQVIE
ncbi:hypothetical protein HHI36_018660, partial [Cryptolaemus montrouzieri]